MYVFLWLLDGKIYSQASADLNQEKKFGHSAVLIHYLLLISNCGLQTYKIIIVTIIKNNLSTYLLYNAPRKQ